MKLCMQVTVLIESRRSNIKCVHAHNKSKLNVTCICDLNFLEMVEPGQDLLLAALSESGISPNDLFDIDSPDVVLATPTPAVQQVITKPSCLVEDRRVCTSCRGEP